jgi:hypothetical protein
VLESVGKRGCLFDSFLGLAASICNLEILMSGGSISFLKTRFQEVGFY